MLLSHSLVY